MLTFAQSVWNARAGIKHNAPTLCAVGRRIGAAQRESIRSAPAAHCPPPAAAA